MSPPLTHLLILLIVAASILLMLVRPKNIPEVWWVGSGATLLVVLRLMSLHLAVKAIAAGADVYAFLIGMMLLSALARQHGVFDWVSAKATRAAHGSSTRLFALIYGIGILTTVFLSNDATAVVLTPAVLAAVRKARVKPMPYLFACAMIANAASFVLPISNPANLVVFHQGMPSLAHWLAAFSIASLFSILATYGVLRFYFRADLACGTKTSGEPGVETEAAPEVEDIPLRPDGKLILYGLATVVVVLLIASACNQALGLPTCLAALLIAAVVSLTQRRSPLPLLEDLSWSTILLVAGLFIMVSAVEGLGTLAITTAALHWAADLVPLAGTSLVSMTIGVADNLLNNLPLGLVAGATVQAVHPAGLIANAVLVGVDLGPNLSVTGSLATILWLLALRKEKLDVSAWDFLKAGALTMPIAMVSATGGLLLSHWLLRS